MKNIFTTIEYVAEKILEAITGHNSQADAHPTLTQQINVLKGKVDNLSDNAFNENHLFNDLPIGRSLFLSTDSFGGINSCNVLTEKTRWFAKQTIYRNDTQYVKYAIKYRIMSNTDTKWGDWQQIATTQKTEILLENGWAKSVTHAITPIAYKCGDICAFRANIVNPSTVNAESIICILPSWFYVGDNFYSFVAYARNGNELYKLYLEPSTKAIKVASGTSIPANTQIIINL